MIAQMTEEERKVWRAAYAAAFMVLFHESELGAREARVRTPFDRAVDLATAEAPIVLADLAVIRLREWRRDERSMAGWEIDPFHARPVGELMEDE